MITKIAERVMLEDVNWSDPDEVGRVLSDKDTTLVFDNAKTKAALEQEQKGMSAVMQKTGTPPPTSPGEVKIKGGKWGVPLGVAAAVGLPIAGIYAYRNILRRNKKNK